MAAYRRVYDSRHLQADCQEPGSAPEPHAHQSSMGYLYLFIGDSGHLMSVLTPSARTLVLTTTLTKIANSYR